MIAQNYSSNKLQCNQEIRQLHLGLRKLKIGTYVAQNPDEVPESERNNPYYPIATATLGTPVFDVVHMFSERSISAVPIINEEGIVVNLYETVDVIVSPHHFSPRLPLITIKDSGSLGSISITRPHNSRSPEPTITRFSRRSHLYSFRFPWNTPAADQAATGTQARGRRRRGKRQYLILLSFLSKNISQEEEKRGGKKGRLLGIITLSDVLRHVIGKPPVVEPVEVDEDLPSASSQAVFEGVTVEGPSTSAYDTPVLAPVDIPADTSSENHDT